MIKAVIFDWAGTTVDYGCFAPLDVFIQVYKEKNIEVSSDEVRLFMGMMKKDHIRELSKLDSVKLQWKNIYERDIQEEDIDEMFNSFQPLMIKSIYDHSDLIPGIVETVSTLKEMGLKIGSSTGYNSEMMEIVTENAARQGYIPDSVVDSSMVSNGRPYPWMIYRNCENLDIYPMSDVVKVGDTLADIAEGKNAGAISVGVIFGSSEMGLSQEDELILLPSDLSERAEIVRKRYFENGADYVIERISDVPELIKKINEGR
ncbi:MAG: phosphonoacetaldehyde hydrolase [Candidatus Delongbacteria bacterium]|nr:phosphonoacetaldehyde hydrolase [Candidatus Delongbacteria bacterium]MBN2834388.1 phosphonoacetaldehyde hydrolase [Candidatus Delongbacteria bacterium]